MKSSNIALLAAVGLSTVAIAQTSPQTTPANNTAMDNTVADNVTMTPPSETVEDAPQTTGNATDPTITTGDETVPKPQRR